MDHRYERIEKHLEGCLLEAAMFERTVDGSQLFDSEIVVIDKVKWLVLAAGISEGVAEKVFSSQSKRERAIIPMQVSPNGQASLLLRIRPVEPDACLDPTRHVTFFTSDVSWVEMQESFFRVDGLESPAVQQIRWELDPRAGNQMPMEDWLKDWAHLLGCNPAHAPSHWHINSPPIEAPGPRKRQRTVVTPPELRLATGLPNPLTLVLSLANWLRQANTIV